MRSRAQRAARGGVIAALGAVLAICTAGATAGQRTTAPGPAFKEVGRWGKAGKADGQFGSNAFGLATDKSGNVYVADSDNSRVQVFTSKGGFVSKLYETNTSVLDVAVDPEGNIWATNDTGAQASQFSKGGAPLASIGTPKSALGIAVDAQGSAFVVTYGDNIAEVVRYDKTATGWEAGKMWGGFQKPHDVEVSLDGSVYVSDNGTLNVWRYDRDGKLLKAIKGGSSAPIGVGVDPDCNIWMTNIAQRNLVKYSPAGKLLATAAAADLIAQDIAVGPTGDLYAFDSGTQSIVHFAEDRSKPGAAAVPARLTATNKVVKVKYTLNGVACPAQLDATASLAGKGIAGKAAVKVAAGKTTLISIPLTKAASGPATFTIVLKTNGRATRETRAVSVTVPKA